MILLLDSPSDPHLIWVRAWPIHLAYDSAAGARAIFRALLETFWLVPALMVLGGIVAVLVLVEVDRSGLVPARLIDSSLLYSGGGTGARPLLGAVAPSTIGVAGTVFSIVIAALSLAAGQMGPRLLRTFTADRGNQATLGASWAPPRMPSWCCAACAPTRRGPPERPAVQRRLQARQGCPLNGHHPRSHRTGTTHLRETVELTL